jgi:hypothetical protein
LINCKGAAAAVWNGCPASTPLARVRKATRSSTKFHPSVEGVFAGESCAGKGVIAIEDVDGSFIVEGPPLGHTSLADEGSFPVAESLSIGWVGDIAELLAVDDSSDLQILTSFPNRFFILVES